MRVFQRFESDWDDCGLVSVLFFLLLLLPYVRHKITLVVWVTFNRLHRSVCVWAVTIR